MFLGDGPRARAANPAPPPLKQQLDTTDWLHPAPVPLVSDLRCCAKVLCFVDQQRAVDALQHLHVVLVVTSSRRPVQPHRGCRAANRWQPEQEPTGGGVTMSLN